MTERREYQMSAAQLKTLLDACRPVPYLVFGGVEPRSPQENANAAWADLGRQMGFDGKTAKPIPGRGPDWFTAEPVEVAP